MASEQLPPLTQLVAPSRAPQAPARPILSEVKTRTPVLRVKGTKDTTSKVLAALNKRRGREGAVSNYTRSSESVLAAVKYVIRVGIDSFDAGTGGICFGKVTEIYGLPMCGKTALVMLACGAAAQGEIYEVHEDGSQTKLNVPFEVTVLYEDNENSLQQGERLMVYDQEVDVIAGECDSTDQIFKDIETAAEAIQNIQKQDEEKAKKDKEFIAPIQFLVVVVDTIAGTSTRQELKQEWSKVDFSRQPIQLREGFRNTIRRLKENNIAMICTNQVGQSFKPKPRGMVNKSLLPQPGDFSSPGGFALQFYAHLRVFVSTSPFPYKLTDGKFADGLVIQFFTVKNRFRAPLRQGRMVLMFKNAMCQDPTEWETVIRPARIQEMVEREREKGNKKFAAEDAEKLFPKDPPGGLSPIWSMLEHLVYMGFIKVTASRGYKVNFDKYGITASTPVAEGSGDLQTLDANLESEAGDIEIPNRLAWPEFYRTHKTEISVLFSKCVERMFAQNGGTVETGGDAEADDESGGDEDI